MTREQALEAIGATIRYGRQSVAEVEFSAEDAGRTDLEYLCQVCRVAVDAGATILNLPDTVWVCGAGRVRRDVCEGAEFLGDQQGITLSAHCHDDLGWRWRIRWRRFALEFGRLNARSTESANGLEMRRWKRLQ